MATLDSCCDLCRGTSFEPYTTVAPPGRELLGCTSCGLVTALPASRRTAPMYDSHRDSRSDARRATALMRLLPSGRILEIGCGEGRVLAGLDPARYAAVGLETSADLAAAARRRLRGKGVRGDVLAAAPSGARLAAASFDLIAMFGTLSRSPSPRALLMEASRLLKDGGYAVVETPGLSSLTAKLFGARWQPLRDTANDYFFTAATLERLAAVCGLTAGSFRPTVLVGWPPPGTLVYIGCKTAASVKAPGLASLAGQVGKMTPMGATD